VEPDGKHNPGGKLEPLGCWPTLQPVLPGFLGSPSPPRSAILLQIPWPIACLQKKKNKKIQKQYEAIDTKLIS